MRSCLSTDNSESRDHQHSQYSIFWMLNSKHEQIRKGWSIFIVQKNTKQKESKKHGGHGAHTKYYKMLYNTIHETCFVCSPSCAFLISHKCIFNFIPPHLLFSLIPMFSVCRMPVYVLFFFFEISNEWWLGDSIGYYCYYYSFGFWFWTGLDWLHYTRNTAPKLEAWTFICLWCWITFLILSSSSASAIARKINENGINSR